LLGLGLGMGMARSPWHNLRLDFCGVGQLVIGEGSIDVACCGRAQLVRLGVCNRQQARSTAAFGPSQWASLGAVLSMPHGGVKAARKWAQVAQG
jgi:hypothetical protein